MSEIHASRRRRLMDEMARCGEAPVALVFGARASRRNGSVDYPFRQSSALHYLTGFIEPGAVAVLAPAREAGAFVLFVPPRDPEREIWDGPRAGVEGAVARYGADEAFPLAELAERLPALVDGADVLLHDPGLDAAHDAVAFTAMRHHLGKPREPRVGPDRLVTLASLLDELRWRKTDAELDALRRAARVTALAHREVMRAAQPGRTEAELHAILDFSFRVHGAARVGYEPIVASGPNATILHYVANDREIGPGELVLVDAGAEVDYFTADVTRTFPASGRFSGPQRDVYDAVLAAQTDAIAACVPGQTVQAIHEGVVRALTASMVELGLLAGELDGLIERKAYKRWFPHRTSHWLGMDVHDVGRYWSGRQPRPLEPGVVLTVEPGLYIRADDDQAPPALRGIGVRLEDDVLVTEGEPWVLTGGVPKAPSEVEALCQERSRFAPLLP